MKNTSKDYLHFSRKEKNGIVIILVISLLTAIAPYVYSALLKDTPSPAFAYAKEMALLKEMKDSSNDLARNETYATERNYTYKPGAESGKENLSATLFRFDPNTLDISGWQKLGVKEKTATGIQHYIEKGGRFREPQDIKKIWGLSEAMKTRLLPYVNIPAQPEQNEKRSYAYEKSGYQKRSAKPFDANSGDTSAFIALPGIGSKLAARIVNFRERLGGFYSVEQVGETFGLPDSTFQKIKPLLQVSASGIKKINLNTAKLDELKQHPYIRWQLANVIIQYRIQHGNFTSVDDLKKIMIIKEDIFSKISPYCKVE